MGRSKKPSATDNCRTATGIAHDGVVADQLCCEFANEGHGGMIHASSSEGLKKVIIC
jgi:delta-aminolevulinic acid dehydratase/porphobilinogen synthase